jgi:hypothetical protein
MDRRVSTVYTHTQDTASDTWTIVHSLYDYPIVDVYVDYNGVTQKIIPANIEYSNTTTCVVTFTQPYAGYAVVV